jgi:hypothetical protein
MNERINELRLEAGISRLHDEPKFMVAVSKEGTVIEPLDGLEKFAKLIVRECYEHCKGQVLDKEVADTNELTYNDAVSDCANGLLQHFGVDE